MTDIREKIKAKIKSGIGYNSLRDKFILCECMTWACWKELDEEEQAEVIGGYESVARFQHSITATLWAERCMKLVEALEKISMLTAYAGTPTKEIAEYLIKQAGVKAPEIAREVLKDFERELEK